MENQEKITPTRRERVNVILDTLGDIVETDDFSIHVSYGRAYVQLYSRLSELAGAHGAGIRVERTNYGTVKRSAVIGVQKERFHIVGSGRREAQSRACAAVDRLRGAGKHFAG